MSVDDINCFFENNYNWLKKISQSNIYLNKSKNVDADELISLMYLHLIKNKEDLKGEDDILDYCGRYSIQNAYWKNSEFNKIASVNNKVTIIGTPSDFDPNALVVEEGDVILRERDLEEKWSIIDNFIMTLTEKWERRYATVYFSYIKDGKRPSVRALKNHFNIGHAPSHKIKKEFESKLNEYLKTRNVVKNK